MKQSFPHRTLPSKALFKDWYRMTSLAAWVFVVLTSSYLLWFLYHAFAATILFPTAIDQAQISAKEEKLNRALLDSILRRDAQNRQPPAPTAMRDPFVR